jgi:hypothetical protein
MAAAKLNETRSQKGLPQKLYNVYTGTRIYLVFVRLVFTI